MVGVRNQDTMNELASRTGGHAYYNRNDIDEAIHTAVDDSRVTYMLGFYPVDESFDGKFHKIDVEVIERKAFICAIAKDSSTCPNSPRMRRPAGPNWRTLPGAQSTPAASASPPVFFRPRTNRGR